MGNCVIPFTIPNTLTNNESQTRKARKLEDNLGDCLQHVVDTVGEAPSRLRVEQAIQLARLTGLDPRLYVSDGAHLGVCPHGWWGRCAGLKGGENGE